MRHGPLPDVLPLLAAAQAVPHVPLTDRTGADMAPGSPTTWPGPSGHGAVTPSTGARGGWSSHGSTIGPRPSGSPTLGGGHALTRLVDQGRGSWLAGDVHALQLLHEQAPKRVRELLEVVGGEYGSLEAVFAEADKLVAATVQADNRALLDRFAEELGQRDPADGAAATLAALGRGQVETLLLTGLFLDDERTPRPAPTDVAATRHPAGLGVPDPGRPGWSTGRPGRPRDRRRRRARTRRRSRPGPGEGVGALLRFPLGP